ncbi:flagellar export protein FliJ [Panacagrimonas sp.]|uniref:flagellar export protein FliJ n=1 Tax=Panacagrimonas sp. TaxID=2480088 RepID=UPI003B52784E
MVMSVDRLEVLVKVAASRADRAAEEVGRRKAGLNEQEHRLQELRRYMDDYRSRPLPLSSMLIANRERFMARLGEAEAQQRRTVEQATHAVHESTRSWLEQRAGQQKFGVLQTAAIDRQNRTAEQHQQRGLDEFALRVFAGRPGANTD